MKHPRIQRIVAALFNNPLTRSATLIAFVLVLPLTGALILAELGVPVKGFEWLEEDEPAPLVVEKPEVTVVDFTATPANAAFEAVYKRLNKEWDGTASPVTSAGLPHPFECISPAPALSSSRTYDAGGREVAVTLAAYPAGVGGELYSRLRDDTAECRSSGTSIYTYGASGLGVEASTAEVEWAANDIEVTFFRRGDVVAFVATSDGDDSQQAAGLVDSILNGALNPNVCAVQGYPAQDQARNAFFSGKGFRGKLETRTIKAKKLSRPQLLPEQKEAGVKRVKVPSPAEPMMPTSLPSDDFNYPLWPPLPDPVEIPSTPSEPRPQKLEEEATFRVPDPVGPGCGWSFLTTIQPNYDEAQVNANNEALLTAAKDVLVADGTRWKRAMRSYWVQYHTYLTEEVPAYRTYRKEVLKVADAWQAIHEAWDRYYTAYANWENREAARVALIAEQDAARALFAEQKQACATNREDLKVYRGELKQYQAEFEQYEEDQAAYDEEQAQYEEDLQDWKDTPKDERGPKPERPTTEKPVEPVQPVKPVLPHPCPPIKAAVLDVPVPEQTKPPKRPADPRPVSERGTNG